jgi:hypothetical protein
MIDPSLVSTILQGVGSAFVASMAYYGAKRRKRPDVEFKPHKTTITLSVAFVISLAVGLAPDVALTQATLEQYMIYSGPAIIYLQKLARRFVETDTGENTTG